MALAWDVSRDHSPDVSLSWWSDSLPGLEDSFHGGSLASLGSLVAVFGKRPPFPTVRSLHREVEFPHNTATDLPQSTWARRREAAATASHDQASKVTLSFAQHVTDHTVHHRAWLEGPHGGRSDQGQGSQEPAWGLAPVAPFGWAFVLGNRKG